MKLERPLETTSLSRDLTAIYEVPFVPWIIIVWNVMFGFFFSWTLALCFNCCIIL